MLPGFLAEHRRQDHLLDGCIELRLGGMALPDDSCFRPNHSHGVLPGVEVAFAQQQTDITAKAVVEADYPAFFFLVTTVLTFF